MKLIYTYNIALQSLKAAVSQLENYFKDICSWAVSNKIKLNNEKSEFIVFSSKHHMKDLVAFTRLIGNVTLKVLLVLKIWG